jgi:hypothetical protein
MGILLGHPTVPYAVFQPSFGGATVKNIQLVWDVAGRRYAYRPPYIHGYYDRHGVYWFRGAPGYPYYAPYAFPHYPPYPPGQPPRTGVLTGLP